ncbi:MAG: hypothetical protein EXX96DRAFT_626311 [Benjaminiella poitrasii]|nr:MAG: hypothetical protein EXX96DRAFT_626311 [Benjaminiella poitrasii]
MAALRFDLYFTTGFPTLFAKCYRIPGYGSTLFSSARQNTKSIFAKRGEDYVCSSDDAASLMLTHFSAIFFGDFDTDGGQDILGPLAVQGKFKASSYMVNANENVDCSSDSGIESYGLVVGGSVDADGVRVRGNAEVPAGSTGLQETVNSCSINKGTTGLYDFDQAQENAISASQILAGLKPNLYLDSNGKLSKIGSATDDFNVITFNTCNDGDCKLYAGEMSDPSALLEGIGNWNGPQGMSWPSSGTLVLNIPVDTGSTFTIKGNNLNQGMKPCITIFNFYPSDSSGKYSSGSFTLKRDTGSNFGGFTLAPEASIVDGSTGAFAGTVIGADYSWGGSGIEIHNYQAAGGSCTNFEGCIPITNGKKHKTKSSSSTKTKSKTKSTTKAATTTTNMINSTKNGGRSATTTTTTKHHHSTTKHPHTSTTESASTSTESSKHHHSTTKHPHTSTTESASTSTESTKHHHHSTTESASTSTESSKHHHSTTKHPHTSTTESASTSTESTKHHHHSTTESASTSTESSKHHHSTTKHPHTSTTESASTSTESSKHHHSTTKHPHTSTTESASTSTESSKHHHSTTKHPHTSTTESASTSTESTKHHHHSTTESASTSTESSKHHHSTTKHPHTSTTESASTSTESSKHHHSTTKHPHTSTTESASTSTESTKHHHHSTTKHPHTSTTESASTSTESTKHPHTSTTESASTSTESTKHHHSTTKHPHTSTTATSSTESATTTTGTASTEYSTKTTNTMSHTTITPTPEATCPSDCVQTVTIVEYITVTA